MTLVRTGILTVSDRCFKGECEDKSAQVLHQCITDNDSAFDVNCAIIRKLCVPDEESIISQTLEKWSDEGDLDLIITCGGTGFAKRDVTPEATKKVLEKEAAGVAIAILMESIKIKPVAMLSRLLSGIRKGTLIVNFPGSPQACAECWKTIKPILKHSTDILSSNDQVNEYHKEMNINKVSPNNATSEVFSNSKVNITQIAKRPRNSPYPMTPVKEAQEKILQIVGKMKQISTKTRNALGYVLFSDVRAREPYPPFRASVKDGYAVLSDDGCGTRIVISNSLSGYFEHDKHLLQPGECVRITTGAPVPDGADAVIQVEDTKLVSADVKGTMELLVDILKSPIPGQDIREVGCDIQKGEVIAYGGTVLTPSVLGVLATAGILEVDVFRKPTVGVLSTGNEIQPFEEPVQAGKIRDSNKITLMALLEKNGFSALDIGIAIDDPVVLLNRFGNTLASVDVLITTGGVSMGEKDLVTNVLLEDFKAKMHFGRVNMKPGKPTKFFEIPFDHESKFVFALPGNPVSAAVTFQLFILPALKLMSGVEKPLPMLFKAKTVDDIELDERNEFARASLSWLEKDTIPSATLTGNQISSRLLNMVTADCLLHLPAASDNEKILPSGSIVDAQFI